MSLQGAPICCWGCSDVTCNVAGWAGGWCGAFVLLGGSNGFFASSATGSISVDGPGLAGSPAGWINFLFLIYLAPELQLTWYLV